MTDMLQQYYIILYEFEQCFFLLFDLVVFRYSIFFSVYYLVF